MKISLLHPSRSRPEKSLETASKWVSYADGDIELIVSLDWDDPFIKNYEKQYSNFDCTLLVGGNISAVHAINNAAKLAKGDILIVVSDDTDCFPGWYSHLSKEVEGKKDWILKTQDGIQKWIITMPIMDRDYYNRFGYVYHPDYKHMFCDTELTCVADLTGRKITSNLLFRHNHYSVTKQNPDSINIKADATWAQGEKLFIDRYKRNFDLKECRGKITSQEYLNWIRSKI